MKAIRRAEDRGTLIRMKGSPYWYADFVDADGVRHRQSTKQAEEAKAQKVLGRLLAEVDSHAFRAPAAQRLTVAQLLASVVPDLEARGKRSAKRARQGIAAITKTTLAGRKAARVTTDTLTRYVLERRDMGAADATVKYELALVRRAFRLAVRDRRLSSAPEIPSLSVHNARNVLIDRAAFERIRTAMGQVRTSPEMLYDLVTIGYYLGWRLNETLGLTWDRIDVRQGTIRLLDGTDAALTTHTTKNDEGRVLRFDTMPELAEALQRRRAYTEAMEVANGARIAFVFHRNGKRVRDVKEAWETALEKAGFPKVKDARGRTWNAYRWHDFRRTTATTLIEAGVPEEVAMKVTGHRTREVFRRYRIVGTTALAEAGRLRTAHEGRLKAESSSGANRPE